MRGNTPDNIYTILTGGKTLLGYCFKTSYKVFKMPVLPYLPLKLYTTPVYYLYKIIYLSLVLFPSFHPINNL